VPANPDPAKTGSIDSAVPDASNPPEHQPPTAMGNPFASLPRWRQWLLGACNTARHLGATLNWRRDPDYERLLNMKLSEIEQL
jgi:hypothetical protein